MASAFDGRSDHALVLERVARQAAREDFALLVDEVEQEVRVFVVDVFDPEAAEAAVFFAFLADFGIIEKLDIFFSCHDAKN